MHRTVRVPLGQRSYDISIGVGLLDQVEVLSGVGSGDSAVIVTNAVVARHYLPRVQNALSRRCSRVHVVVVPDGEAHKTADILALIHTRMLELGIDRKSVLFALGGGVVGDLSGFAAATYQRGIRFVQIPTTLLAQVDSSVGGKTGINHPLGKNMIGAFYQPEAVVADIECLRTLPKRELLAGLAEVIKYGAIWDLGFLGWLELHLDDLIALNPGVLAEAVEQSCKIKAEIVGEDERESGVRASLNFGHTFGHAIETGTGYGTWLHGEAVSAGMVLAAALSCRLGMLQPSEEQRLASLLVRAGLPVRAPALGVDRYLELMQHDKKTEGGRLKFVLLAGLGKAALRADVPGDELTELLDRFV